jgi:hypothetical protein
MSHSVIWPWAQLNPKIVVDIRRATTDLRNVFIFELEVIQHRLLVQTNVLTPDYDYRKKLVCNKNYHQNKFEQIKGNTAYIFKLGISLLRD